ncbi:MAG: acriflavin resistance protein, partial [Bacteroidetes bacterium HGW-Bacteroidetes-22]
NIYSKIESGLDPVAAGHKGSQEIIFAIVSTTITLAVVFLPIIFLQGLTGRLFREFAVVVAGAVLISAFVSLTLTPMMSARMLHHQTYHTAIYRWSERFFIGMTTGYNRSLKWFIMHRYIALLIMVLSVLMVAGLGSLLQTELAPMEDKSRLMISATAPEGTSFEAMDAYMTKLVSLADTIPEKETILAVTASYGTGSVNSGFVRVGLVSPDQRERSQQEITDYLTKELKKYNFARAYVTQEQTINTGMRSGLPVQFVVQAPDIKQLKETLPVFMEKAQGSDVFQVVDVNLKFSKPELRIEIDRDRASTLGVSVNDIAENLQLFFSGQRYGYFIYHGKQYQVIGQASRLNRDEPADLTSIYIRSNTGELIQLS